MRTTTGNTFEFRLPDIGEGTVEGELVSWKVAPGDEVAADQPMFEVMTDKATVEIPSPRKGRVAATYGQVGQTIKVGDVVVVLELAAGESAPVSHGHAPARRAERPAPTVIEAGPVGSGRVLATPATRKLARELGVDLAAVRGTGPRGRVTRQDLEAHRAAPREAASAAPASVAVAVVPEPTGAREQRVPLRGLRKKIAEKMVQSAYTAPHFTYMDEFDASMLVAMRAQAKDAAAAQGLKLTYLPYLMKAVVAALKKYPLLNSSLDDATGEIVIKRYYHLGIAVAGEGGLIVPVIRDVDRKSLAQLAQEVAEAAERARAGRSHPDELKGGTFTISSVGSVGGLFATPILNYPEVGILAVMKIKERPVVKDGAIAVAPMMNLALSFDHRVVDGAVGAGFTNEVIAYLENPARLMLEMA